MYKKLYHDFYVKNHIELLDKELASDVKDYLKYREQNQDLNFVMSFSWANLLNKDAYSKIDDLILELEILGVKKENIIISAFKQNHRYTAKEWKLIQAISKRFEEAGVAFGFDDLYKTFSVAEVENANQKINATVDQIRKSKLSPYEILLMGYLKVTEREYIEEMDGEHGSKSRSVYSILNNEEIVCEGYSEYLKAIIEKVGNENIHVYKNMVATSDDNKFIDDYHANLIIYIKDEKYGIDGYYYLDPTWDSKEDNTVPNLAYFMVPITDIKNIKSVHIVDEEELPISESLKNENSETDVVYVSSEDEDVSFTRGNTVLSQKFVYDYLKLNPNMINILKEEVAQKQFKRDYEILEKITQIVKTEIEVLEMFEGNGIELLDEKSYTNLNNALISFEESADKDKFLAVCELVIGNYYNSIIEGEKEPKKREPLKLLRASLLSNEKKLSHAESARSGYISNGELLAYLETDIYDLVNTICDQIEENSKPVHMGKTMDALRIVYSKMYPDIMQKLIDQRVKETIEYNVNMAKRIYNKKSSSPFAELYGMMGEDKQK